MRVAAEVEDTPASVGGPVRIRLWRASFAVFQAGVVVAKSVACLRRQRLVREDFIEHTNNGRVVQQRDPRAAVVVALVRRQGLGIGAELELVLADGLDLVAGDDARQDDEALPPGGDANGLQSEIPPEHHGVGVYACGYRRGYAMACMTRLGIKVPAGRTQTSAPASSE